MLTLSGGLLAQTYTIKGPDNPLPHEKTAVKELTDYLARRINGTLTIGGKSPVTFQVGDTDLAKQNKLLSTQLPEEKWVIKSFGDQILINGGGTRGALYATYHFLEDYCNIHWWSEYEDYVPKASSLTLPTLDKSGKPAFLYRDIYRTRNLHNPSLMAIRARLNRNGDVAIPAEYGGSFNYGPPYHCHTFDKYVPEAKFFATHPEYFSVRNGKRVGGQHKGQLCLTNPELKQIFLVQLLEKIKEGEALAKKQGVPAPRIYDVSQNDNSYYCQCENCMAFVAKHEHSGLYLTFINWLAGEVAKTRPDLYISTLAYHYSEPPPKGGIHAAKNVIVKLTDTLTNQAASILEPENTVFKKFVEDWKNYADHLFIWDYAITFTRGITGLPFASEFHYGDLYRHYHQNNVSGIFWEHESPHVADMFELKYFIETKLFEDPYQDVNKLINTFMTCYYGEAGPYVLKYRQILDKARKDNKGVVKWFPNLAAFAFITDDVILKCQDALDKAEDAVKGDKLLLSRVRRARLGIDRYTCKTASSLIYHGDNPPPKRKLNTGAAAKRIAESWPEWLERYPDSKGLILAAKTEADTYIATEKTFPPPPEFKDNNFFDFYAGHFEIHSPKANALCDDPNSPVGKAVRTTVSKSDYYKMPFAFGFYNQGTRKGVALKTVKKVPEKPGYNWYNLGVIEIPTDGYVYVTRAWTTKLQTGFNELIGKKFDIWISAKLEGPHFYPDQKGTDYIYVDRIILMEPQK